MQGSLLGLGRLLFLTSARGFLPAAAALLAGSILLAAVLFGEGLHPAEVTRAMAHSWAMRLAVWSVWVAASAPVSGRLVGRSWARSLPLPTWHAVVWWVGPALAAQGPWILLFAVGEGWARGLSNGLLAVTIGFALATGSAPLLVLAALGAFVPMPAVVMLPFAVFAAGWTARGAWVAGPREPRPPVRVVYGSSPRVALALASLADLVRSHAHLVGRAGALVVAVAALLRLLGRYDPLPPTAAVERALGVLALPAAIGAAWLAAPLLAFLTRLEPFVQTLGRPMRVLHQAGALVMALAGLLLGAASGVLALGVAGAVLVGSWSAGLSLLVLAAARRGNRARALVHATLIGSAGCVLTLATGWRAVPFAAVAAMALIGWRR